jgi:phage/plasmid-associated DNA primase
MITIFFNKMTKPYHDFLKRHEVNKEDRFTHTSLNSDTNAGRYQIRKSELEKFYSLYFTHTFKEDGKTYLTEKHPDNFSKIVIDLDFRHKLDEDSNRKYDEDFLIRLLSAYYDGLQELFGDTLKTEESFAYILEKDNPEIDENNQVLKDGIHIIFPFICIKYIAQHWLRKYVIEKMRSDEFISTCSNTIDDIIDISVVQRNNFIMYGSRKNAYAQSYKLTRIFDITMEEMELPETDINLLKVLSLQNNFQESETLIDSIIENDEKRKKEMDPLMKIHAVTDTQIVIKKSPEYLLALLSLLKSSRVETYDDWFRIGAILYNIDENNIDLWKKWSSQSTKYDDQHCERLWNLYSRYTSENKVNIGSLRKMSWEDSPARYFSVMEKYSTEDDLTGYIRRSLRNTHTEFAELTHFLLSSKYKYSNGTWYYYSNRWRKLNEPVHLLKDISLHVRGALFRYSSMLSTKIADLEQSSGNIIPESDPVKVMKIACEKSIHTLKSYSYKSSVSNECKEIFYDENFFKELDMDNYLLGFDNGVYNLKTGIFRDSNPDDKISYSTGYDYSSEVVESIRLELIDLFEKSLPDKDVREFTWLFLSSTLIGTNKNELFVNFEGTGGNGKGVITTIHDNSFGDYAGVLDSSYLTNVTNSQEGHNSKLADLMSKRYVQSNEPSNGKTLNIDFIKEITGGDKIQIRKAHSPNPELSIIPQFTLVMLCNKMPKIDDVHDGGFIRRYVGINFPNRFVMYEPKKANEFKADPNLKSKLKDNVQYRQQYMLILLEYVKKYIANNQKLVIPALISMNSSRVLKNQDCYSEFIGDMIEITECADDGIILRDLFAIFRDYYQEHISGGKKSPITQTDFVEKMKTCFADYRIEYKTNVKIEGVSRGKGFTGIKVRDDFENIAIDNE